MTVVERTSGGYVKGVDKNGNTFHRDPNGHPVIQQSFAGSRGGKVTAEKYDTVPEFDDEGKFKGATKVPKDTGEIPKDVTRVTATIKKYTDTTTGAGIGDSVTAKLEISGAFRPGNAPSDQAIKGRMEQIFKNTKPPDQKHGFEKAMEKEFSVEKAPSVGPAYGWNSVGDDLDIDFDRGQSYEYDIDAKQKKLSGY